MTFNELMVVILVVTVLVVLGAISASAVMVRTKYHRVKEDHRTISRALDNYQMDTSTLPGNALGLRALERRATYISRLPHDPFAIDSVGWNYVYLQPPIPGIAYVLVSPGPDGDFDLPAELRVAAGLPQEDQVPAAAAIGLEEDAMQDAQVSALALSEAEQGEQTFSQTLGVTVQELEHRRVYEGMSSEQLTSVRRARAEAAVTRQRDLFNDYLSSRAWAPGAPTDDGDIITIVRF